MPARREQRLSVDIADVPLQRLVRSLGADRRRRYPRVPARGARRCDLEAVSRARRHPSQRSAHRCDRHPERRTGRDAGPAGYLHHRRRAAQPRHDRAHGTNGLHGGARLRANRNLRPDFGLPATAGMGCPARRPARRTAGTPGRQHDPSREPACRGCHDDRRSGRWQCDGRGRHARQQRHDWLLPRPGGHRQGVQWRLVPQRRPRRHAPRQIHRTARPHQGHHHLRWRKHFDHRSGAGADEPPLRP